MPRVSGYGFGQSKVLLTLEYVKRIAPWVEQGHKSRRMHAPPSSDESLPSPLQGIPSHETRRA